MIELGCQTYSLRHYPTLDMLVAVRKAGFRAIELWIGHADPNGGAAAAARVRRAADDIGVRIAAYSVGGFVRVALATVEARLAAAFAFAAALEVDLVTGVLDRRAVRVVDALCRRTGIRFALENHWYADFAQAADYDAVLRDASPLVGVALDTGHLVTAGDRPLAALRHLAGRVFDVHLKDVVVARRLERWVLRRARVASCTLGAGEAGIPDFLGALAGDGYVGSIAIEDERPGLPLSELQASLRVATRCLRAAARPLAMAVP